MNSTSSKILKSILLFFILGFCASFYVLYDLPGALENNSPLISPDAIEQSWSVFLTHGAVIVLTLLLGLAYVVIASQNKGEKEIIEKIVYVEKKDEEVVYKKEEEDLQKVDRDKIDAIIGSIKSKKTDQTKYNSIISELCEKLEASQGILYLAHKNGPKRSLKMSSAFAFSIPDSEELVYEFGEGLPGQAAKEAKTKKIEEIPEEYMAIQSGLGEALPKQILLQPISKDNNVVGLVELASFKEFTSHDEIIIKGVTDFVGNEIISKEKEVDTEPKTKKKKPTSTKPKDGSKKN